MSVEIYDLSSLVRERAEQSSYHLFSERHIRMEVFNFGKGESLGPFQWEGNVAITLLQGSATLEASKEVYEMSAMSLTVLKPLTTIRLLASEGRTSALVTWVPPFAQSISD